LSGQRIRPISGSNREEKKRRRVLAEVIGQERGRCVGSICTAGARSPLGSDPTGFAEEEDFDFGLLLTNLSRDPARHMRMFAGAVQADAPARAGLEFS
jgi:hypothetical protein